MGSKVPSSSTFDSLLVSYQKRCLFLLYPALISAVSLFIGMASPTFSYALCFGSISTLAHYFALNPLNGSSLLSNFVVGAIGILLLLLFVGLSLLSAKGKFWPLLLGSALYLGDFIYTCCLIIPSLYGHLEVAIYVTSLVIHLLFLVLFSFIYCSYGKLLRFPKEKGGLRNE